MNYEVQSISHGSKDSTVPNSKNPQNIIEVSPSPHNNPSKCDSYLRLHPFPTQNFSINNEALIVDKDHPMASDANDGRYIENGGTGPFKTITKLLSTIQAGQTGYIRQSSTPYNEVGTNVDSHVGLQVLNSGTQNQPIIISGFPGERPVITKTGFNIISQSHIRIQNLEIFDITGIGVYVGSIGPGHEPTNINLEHLYIHYMYGGDNIGGVRLDDCENCSLKNSVVKNTYDTRPTATGKQDNEPYPFHAGVHGYRPRNVTIQNNVICNTKRGVYQKHPNSAGHKSNHVISNVFINTSAAYSLEMAGIPKLESDGSLPPPYTAIDANFSYNLVIDVSGMVNTILHESSIQSTGLNIYNNTGYNSAYIYYGSGMKDVNSFNNIIYGSTGARPYSVVNKSNTPVNPSYDYPHEYFFDGQLNYIDHNQYFEFSQMAHLGRYGDTANEFMINSFSDWKTSYTDTSSKFMTQNPDQNSLAQDPSFKNIEAFDFTPLTPTAGRGSTWDTKIGAFTDNHKPGIID